MVKNELMLKCPSCKEPCLMIGRIILTVKVICVECGAEDYLSIEDGKRVPIKEDHRLDIERLMAPTTNGFQDAEGRIIPKRTPFR